MTCLNTKIPLYILIYNIGLFPIVLKMDVVQKTTETYGVNNSELDMHKEALTIWWCESWEYFSSASWKLWCLQNAEGKNGKEVENMK